MVSNDELSDADKREENLRFLREKVMAFSGDPNAGGIPSYTFPSTPGSKKKGADVHIDIPPFPRLIKSWIPGTGVPIVERVDAQAYKAHGDKYLTEQFKTISVDDLIANPGPDNRFQTDWWHAKSAFYKNETGEDYNTIPYPYPGFGGEGIGGG